MEAEKEIESRIGIELPEDEFDILRDHSSYQPQEPEVQQRNKQLAKVGVDLIRCCFEAYLFIQGLVGDQKQFSYALNTKTPNLIMNDVYETYKLEDFVLKSKGEESILHPDIAGKIAYLIFKDHGLVRLYRFLEPFLKKYENSNDEDMDYKTIVQEYAQKNGLRPSYDLVEMSGPEHELKCLSKVTVGKMMAWGSGIGKRIQRRRQQRVS